MTHQPDPIECREAFENWHDSLFDISARSSCKNEYGYPQDSAIQTRWQAWQACWNRPAIAPVAMGEDEAVEELCVGYRNARYSGNRPWKIDTNPILRKETMDYMRAAFRALAKVADITKRPQAERTDEKEG